MTTPALVLSNETKTALDAGFLAAFGCMPARYFSAPGRTEIGGNHTDHNRGRVLAASVNLDALCAASPRTDEIVHFESEGYAPISVDLTDTGKLRALCK